jgi:hypothetical protein
VADTKHNKHYHNPSEDRFEKSDASFVQIGIWMFVILFLVLLTALAAWGYFNHYMDQHLSVAKAQRSPLLKDDQKVQQIPGPELQVNPTADMKAFAIQQDHDINSYAWVSREAGVVRIPIEEAKKKVLEQGLLKSRAAAPETTSTVPQDGASMPQDSSSGRTYWNLQR